MVAVLHKGRKWSRQSLREGLADAGNHSAPMPRICSYRILSSRSAAAFGSASGEGDEGTQLRTWGPQLWKEKHITACGPTQAAPPSLGCRTGPGWGGWSFKRRAEGLFSSLLTSGPTISGLLNQYYFFLSDFFFPLKKLTGHIPKSVFLLTNVESDYKTLPLR